MCVKEVLVGLEVLRMPPGCQLELNRYEPLPEKKKKHLKSGLGQNLFFLFLASQYAL